MSEREYLSDADASLLAAIQSARSALDSEAAALNARAQALTFAADALAARLKATYTLNDGCAITPEGRIVRTGVPVQTRTMVRDAGTPGSPYIAAGAEPDAATVALAASVSRDSAEPAAP